MQVLKLLACASLIAFASTTGAFAADDQKSPNCSPGEKGCSANYPTSDVSKTNPAANATKDQMSPNCSPGEKGCSANYPTTNVTKTAPTK
jgi:hypothetical protein